MESFKKFEVGDFVEAYKKFCGYITWIDHKNESADVEWEESDLPYPNCVHVPFKYLEKVEG